MVRKISDENFEEDIINSSSLSVILFSSPWCSTCKNVALQLESISDAFDNVLFGKCDITTGPQTTVDCEVMSVQSVLIFKGGKEIKRFIGDVSGKDLMRAIEKII